jgi:hypothetical protein
MRMLNLFNKRAWSLEKKKVLLKERNLKKDRTYLEYVWMYTKIKRIFKVINEKILPQVVR